MGPDRGTWRVFEGPYDVEELDTVTRRGDGHVRTPGSAMVSKSEKLVGRAVTRFQDVTSRGRLARWTPVVRQTLSEMKRDRVNVAAGAFAYRWFLSIFPLIIALLGIASLVTIPHRLTTNLIHGVTTALPSGAAAVLTQSITRAQSHTGASLTTTVLASVVALWSSTSGMVIVEEGLDIAYGLSTDRSFVTKRLVALPLLGSAIVLGGAASALAVFGSPLGRLLQDVVPLRGVAFHAAWDGCRWLMALALVNLLLSVLYYLAPNHSRPRWRWTSVGAMLATAVWALVSLGFSLYTSIFGSFGSTYGAFAGVAILIFWLYLSGLAILMGAEVDAVLEKSRTVDGGRPVGRVDSVDAVD